MHPKMQTETIVVNFQDWAMDEEIYDLIDKHKLEAVRTSSLRKKYAVDVPVGTVQKFINILANESLVKSATL